MDEDIRTETLLADLVIGESPRWHDGRLWFCHWGADDIVAVDPDGAAEVVLHDPAIGPHSIDWLPDGRMLMVAKNAPYAGRLLRREPDGSIVTHADLSGLAAGWNELVVDGRGNTYVNGSDFDLLGFFAGTAEFRPGLIALVTPDGEVRTVAEDIQFGNGMAVTPDNRTLIVADSFAEALLAFDIAPDGGLTNRRVWASGLTPDGICIDAEGAVWTSATAFRSDRATADTEEAPPGRAGATAGGEGATAGREEATAGREEATAGREEATAGREEATAGGDGPIAAGDPATAAPRDHATAARDQAAAARDEAAAARDAAASDGREGAAPDGRQGGRGGQEKDCVRVAEGGRILTRIPIDRSAFALMLGGPERRTLHIMAARWNPADPWGERTGRVLTAPAPAPGAGWPSDAAGR